MAARTPTTRRRNRKPRGRSGQGSDRTGRAHFLTSLLFIKVQTTFEVTRVRAILMEPRFRPFIPQPFVMAFHVLCQLVATSVVDGTLGGLLQKRCA